MEVKNLSSWSEFEDVIRNRLTMETDMVMAGPFLYRGQANSSWKLETTLERYEGFDNNVYGYYFDIYKHRKAIETFAGRKWELPNPYDDMPADISKFKILEDENIIDYMQYLRHYGYPSPLLDWSLSPYVAAYFAFRDVSNKAESVAIYDFFASNEYWSYSEDAVGENPEVLPIGISPTQTDRHYFQQSIYTVCVKKPSGKGMCYTSYDSPYVLGFDEERAPQGVPLTKYVIPASERLTALHVLRAYNIDSYSLMGTEESLLESLFLNRYIWEELGKKLTIDRKTPE